MQAFSSKPCQSRAEQGRDPIPEQNLNGVYFHYQNWEDTCQECSARRPLGFAWKHFQVLTTRHTRSKSQLGSPILIEMQSSARRAANRQAEKDRAIELMPRGTKPNSPRKKCSNKTKPHSRTKAESGAFLYHQTILQGFSL